MLKHRIFPSHNALTPTLYATYRDISIFALCNIFFLICVFTPFAVYSSDVSQFDASRALSTLCALFGVFLLLIFVSVYVTSFFYRTRLLVLGAFSVSVILCIGVVYTFILRGDYGAMDHFIIQKMNFTNFELHGQKIAYALLVGLGSICFACVCLRYLKRVWQILFFALICVSVFYTYQITSTHYNILAQRESSGDAQNTQKQLYEDMLFSYAKDKQNIVVFVLDMFSGSHIKPLFEQFPNIKSAFSGFIAFDNATSSTDSTIHSIATIIGGEYYAVYNMNARGDNLKDGITKAFGTIGDTFVQEGYDVAYFMSVAPKPPKDVQIYNAEIAVVQDMSAYNHYYISHKAGLFESVESHIAQSEYADIIRLLSVGAFAFSPEYFFRSRIYNNGLWLLKGDSKAVKSFEAINLDSALFAFSTLHHSTSQKPTFKYLHSLMTHMPYGAYYDDGKCTYFSDKTAWEEYHHKAQMQYRNGFEEREFYYQHYDSEACALSYLASFLQWLKDEAIYDNTQIFIVSDHSGYDSIGIPRDVALDTRPDTLLLFKDFDSRGEIRFDSRLMVNYDIASIFCANLPNGCPNVPPHILKHYPQNRSIISTVPAHWDLDFHKTHQWLINSYYRVQGSIYDSASWQDITSAVQSSELDITGFH